MELIDYGSRVVKICMPDRDGMIDDVVVGYGKLESFENGDRYFGPVIGRFGNRIAHASFELDGVRHDLVANENRGGEPNNIMELLLQVEADTCVQNNVYLCPDLLLPVEGTPFDFREPHKINYRIDMPHEHFRIMKGMSACWVVRDWDGTLRKAADLYDEVSGRGVETWTTEPALLTYTGRGLNPEKYPDGKYGPICQYAGMLLETIHFPDSPNQDRFPTTILRPGEKYHSKTEYRFYAK